MYCPNCGKEMDQQAVFCPSCGAQPHNSNAGNRSKAANAEKLPNIKTLVLVGWIFSLLTLIGLCLYLIIGIVIGTVMGGLTKYIPPGVGAFTFGILIFELIIMAVFAIPTILVFRRYNKMKHASDSGDIATLKALNSTGWAVVALIFCGIIPGIMLLVAHSSIEELV